MSARLIDLLVQFGARERLLLAVLFGLVVPLGIVLGVLLPLNDARVTAISDRTEAVALNLWVQDRVLDLQGLAQSPDAGPRVPIGTSGIEQTLIGVGLRDAVSELSTDSDGVVALRFDNVRFTRLADWLADSDPGWGYRISFFRFDAVDLPGNVAVALTLSPRPN